MSVAASPPIYATSVLILAFSLPAFTRWVTVEFGRELDAKIRFGPLHVERLTRGGRSNKVIPAVAAHLQPQRANAGAANVVAIDPRVLLHRTLPIVVTPL